jgi:hypothetical protein
VEDNIKMDLKEIIRECRSDSSGPGENSVAGYLKTVTNLEIHKSCKIS